MVKNVLYQIIIHSFDSTRKTHASWRHLLLQNDVIRGIRQWKVIFTVEKRYKYIYTYAT